MRFNFAVERVIGAPMAVPPRVSLAWYAGFRDAVQPVGAVQPGERWQLTVRLQRPHGNANPHGFDYEVWLLEQGVRATGYVRPEGDSNRRLDSFVPQHRPTWSSFAAPGCANASCARCRASNTPA